MNKHTQINASRIEYNAPELVDYGSVEELTATGAGGTFDDGAANSDYWS